MVSYIMDHSKPASNPPDHFRCSLESFNETYNIMKCLNAAEGVQKITRYHHLKRPQELSQIRQKSSRRFLKMISSNIKDNCI